MAREWLGAVGFLKELFRQIEKSDLFFMAGAITFNVLVAVIPLILLIVGLTGFVVNARFARPTPELLDIILSNLPAMEGDVALSEMVGMVLEGLIEERTGFSIVGAVVLLWISTRLVASLRVVLRDVFQLGHDRGVVRGKLFDLHVVLLGGVLLLLNVGVTLAARALQAFGIGVFDLGTTASALLQTGTSTILSYGSAWVLFFLLYWYLPARTIPFRTAAVGATFTAVVYELLKNGFAWYVTSVANYSNAYGSMAAVAILFFWIYYSAVVFILGGQVARVYEVRRKERMRIQAGSSGQGSDTGIIVGVGVLLACLLAIPTGLGAQALAPFGGNGNGSGLLNGGEGVVMAANSLERNLSLDQPLVWHDGAYVVVHLAENRVLVLEGTEVVWSAPAGTGHGFQLEGQGREWTFTTPVGLFHVLRKEKDPVWIAPDWYYVQRNIPVPAPQNRARIEGTLGTSAVYLGDGIAIHGTDRPDLLLNPDPEARRVSHGCIRLTNEAARELYHRVSVGTPVLIF